MSYRDMYTSERIMQNLAEENVRKAEARRLAQQLQAGQQSWLSRKACCLGQRIAHFLVATGQRLEQATLLPAEPAEVK